MLFSRFNQGYIYDRRWVYCSVPTQPRICIAGHHNAQKILSLLLAAISVGVLSRPPQVLRLETKKTRPIASPHCSMTRSSVENTPNIIIHVLRDPYLYSCVWSERTTSDQNSGAFTNLACQLVKDYMATADAGYSDINWREARRDTRSAEKVILARTHACSSADSPQTPRSKAGNKTFCK